MKKALASGAAILSVACLLAFIACWGELGFHSESLDSTLSTSGQSQETTAQEPTDTASGEDPTNIPQESAAPTESVGDPSEPTQPPHEHSYPEEWTIAMEPDCENPGFKVRYCSCGDYETQDIPATGHTPVTDPAVAATCKATGLTEGSHCSVCQAVLTAQQITPKSDEHTPDSETGLCACCSDCSVGLIYRLNANETEYSVTGIGECEDIDLVIPGFYMGKPVTAIADFSFTDTSLTSVTFAENSRLTSIGSYAFERCTSLTSIEIPSSVTIIGSCAFDGCDSLTSIEIPSSVTSIGDSAFFKCTGLTSITFNGTQAQWKAITKDSNWDRSIGEYTIHCTDGDISKDGTFTPKSDT